MKIKMKIKGGRGAIVNVKVNVNESSGWLVAGDA